MKYDRKRIKGFMKQLIVFISILIEIRTMQSIFSEIHESL